MARDLGLLDRVLAPLEQRAAWLVREVAEPDGRAEVAELAARRRANRRRTRGGGRSS